MKRYMRAAVALTLFVAGAFAATIASGNSPAALVQTLTTGTTATTGTTGTTGTTTGGTTTTTTTTPARKVTICHHTRSKKNKHVQITVSRSALAAHQRHGDTVGPCTSASALTKHSTSTHVRKFHRGQTLRAEARNEARGKGKGKRRP